MKMNVGFDNHTFLFLPLFFSFLLVFLQNADGQMKAWLLGVLQLSFMASPVSAAPKPFLCLLLLDALSGRCPSSQDNHKGSPMVEFPFSLEWRSRAGLCPCMQDNRQCKFTLCLYTLGGSWLLSVLSRGNEPVLSAEEWLG